MAETLSDHEEKVNPPNMLGARPIKFVGKISCRGIPGMLYLFERLNQLRNRRQDASEIKILLLAEFGEG